VLQQDWSDTKIKFCNLKENETYCLRQCLSQPFAKNSLSDNIKVTEKRTNGLGVSTEGVFLISQITPKI
jgi:hypothetical protein